MGGTVGFLSRAPGRGVGFDGWLDLVGFSRIYSEAEGGDEGESPEIPTVKVIHPNASHND